MGHLSRPRHCVTVRRGFCVGSGTVSAAGIKTIPAAYAAELIEALRRIAFLRPAGDVCGVKLKDAHLLIETMERIALDALGEGL